MAFPTQLPSVSLRKATLAVVQGGGVPMMLKFKYNPEQYSIVKSGEWTRPQTNGAESTPPPQYVSGNPATIEMDIFFDAFDELAGDVSTDVGTLFRWTMPCPPTRDRGLPQPPVLAFFWGSNSVGDFRGFLRRVSARFTMFRVDGTPIRATCSITLEEVPHAIAFTNPTSGTRPGMRLHVLVEGESLHSLAFAEYGKAGFWRAIATLNEIDDPMRVRAGTRLLLPAPRDAAGMA